jgi:outer membrane lipoprotein carrier protein
VNIPFKSYLAIVMSMVLLVAPAFALPNVHQLAQAVDDHYNHLRSLQADFTEIYQGSGITRTESGTLWLKKPGKMRWEYRSPEEKLLIGDGSHAWLYLPAEKQVRKSNMRKLEDLRSPLAFLLGKTKLEKELAGLAFAPEVPAWQEGNSVIRGVPRGLEDRVHEVLLEITPEHQIARIMIHGVDDSITEYRLSDQREDVALADSRFHFSAPAGSETIEDQTGE